jgi:hypothetical protein
MNKNETHYFEIFQSLKRGFLSVWLNRRSLLPMATFPVFVMFTTLVLLNQFLPEDPSYFIIALTQLPADFAIGMFCALIILIIMSAPKRKAGDKPVMFSMNVVEQKKLLITGALAHMVVGYLSMGGLAVMNYFAEPLKQAVDTGETIPTVIIIGLIVSLAVGLYAIRFSFLTILLIGNKDVRGFYTQFKGFGLSIPIFFVKFLSMMALSMMLLVPLSMMQGGGNGEDITPMSDFNTIFVSFLSACATVFAQIWAYASLAIGVRTMTEKEESNS